MSERQLCEHILKKLRDREEQMKTHMAEGAAKDYGEYRFQTGVIKGLRSAALDIQDILQRYEDDDE
jgi:hypothetical protein